MSSHVRQAIRCIVTTNREEKSQCTIHVWPTSNLFKAGHQIRLEISGPKISCS